MKEKNRAAAKKTRGVHWHSSVENNRFATSVGKSVKRKKPINIRKLIKSRLGRGEEEELKRDFEIYGITEEKLKEYFLEESVLFSAVITRSTIELLYFALNKIPKKFITNELEKEDFYILRHFAMLPIQLRKRGWYTSPKKQLRVEKIKLLLQYTPEIVTSFMHEKKDELYISEEVKKEYKKALEELDLEKHNVPSMVPM